MMIKVGPGETYTTIQSGIDAAVEGDTVLVADDNYTGSGNVNLQVIRKAISVKSENGPANCVIDCEHTPDTFGFYVNEALNKNNPAEINGFTIKDGGKALNTGGSLKVGGIYSARSTLILSNNIITGHDGAGIHLWDCQSIIKCNTVSDNNGHGIHGELIKGNIEKNFILRNSGDGIIIYEKHCTLVANIIAYNSGYGIRGMELQETTEIYNNTIVYNNENGIFFSLGDPSFNGYIEIKNSIIRNSGSYEFYCTGGYNESSPPTITISYSNIKGGNSSVFTDMLGVQGDPTPYDPVVWLDGNIDIEPFC